MSGYIDNARTESRSEALQALLAPVISLSNLHPLTQWKSKLTNAHTRTHTHTYTHTHTHTHHKHTHTHKHIQVRFKVGYLQTLCSQHAFFICVLSVTTITMQLTLPSYWGSTIKGKIERVS